MDSVAVGFEKEGAYNRVFVAVPDLGLSCCAWQHLLVGSQPASVSFPSEVAMPATLN